MNDRRRFKRVKCDSKCLVYHARSKFRGTVLNLSLAGAAVMLHGTITGTMKTGDKCNLVLCADPEISFFSYTARITRVGPSVIGLESLDLKNV
jgi:c-di-GMP-binding flagellar brake protein YcgR